LQSLADDSEQAGVEWVGRSDFGTVACGDGLGGDQVRVIGAYPVIRVAVHLGNSGGGSRVN
jgi:hypothetical protein